MTTTTTTKKKSVRWSTVTVYEFGVAIGGSAVPKRGGPAVGLAETPELVWHTTVDAVRGTPLRDVVPSRICSSSSNGDGVTHNVIATGYSSALPALVTDHTSRTSKRTTSRSYRCRSRRVRWLKPLERVTMLERAGYSEKRILRMLSESSQIAMSRRLCLQLATDSSSSAVRAS